MARKLRIEYPGALYHVMKRGDHREAIFRDDRDREGFIETLGEACAKTGWQVHAYCLMPNHFHLVVETPQGNLVGGMKRLQEFKAVRRGWCLGDKAFRKGKMEPRLEPAGCGATERTMKGESAKRENRPLYGLARHGGAHDGRAAGRREIQRSVSVIGDWFAEGN